MTASRGPLAIILDNPWEAQMGGLLWQGSLWFQTFLVVSLADVAPG